jgi:hypothetical protein
VLKFGTVHLNHCPCVAKQDFSDSFDDARLTGPRWSQKQQVSQRAPWRTQSGTKYLIQIGHGLHRFILPNDSLAQPVVEDLRLRAAQIRI